MKLQIVLATHNAHKAKEIREILGNRVPILTMSELGIEKELLETADTIQGNAKMKAEQLASILPDGDVKSIVLADDTGLFVDALSGAPGVYSARFAGESCSYADNNNKLLKELEGVEEDRRDASFKTCFAAVFPRGLYADVIGEVTGSISKEIRGTNGFGYDPLFIEESSGKTYAEMTDEEKNVHSHRAASLNRMKVLLDSYLDKSIYFWS